MHKKRMIPYNPNDTETYEIRQLVRSVKREWLEVVDSGPSRVLMIKTYERLCQEYPGEYFELVELAPKKEKRLSCTERIGEGLDEPESQGIIEKSHDYRLRDFRTLFGRVVQIGDDVEILDGWNPYAKGEVTGFGPHGQIIVRDDQMGIEHVWFADGYERLTDLRLVWPKGTES